MRPGRVSLQVPRPDDPDLRTARSHSDAWVGCIVWSTTASSSAVRGVQVGLPAQPGAERLDCAGGVVAAAVEAPVHGLLGPFGGKEGAVGASSVGL